MHKLIYIILFSLFIFSCKKEETSWDTDLSVPLAFAQLGVGDLLPDSMMETATDQKVILVFNENIFEFGIDSLLDIQSDTIHKSFSIAPLLEFTFGPGQTFYSTGETFNFQNIEAQISYVLLKNGMFHLRAENSISGALDIVLQIPKATKNGVPFELTQTIPAAGPDGNGVLETEIDVSGYKLNLSGQTGSEFNLLQVEFILKNPVDAQPITAYNSDIVTLDLSYSDLDIAHAVGYFGSETVNVSAGSGYETLKEYNEAVINLNEAVAEVKFTNGFGVDIQATIFQLKAWNTKTGNSLNLSNSLIGSAINLSRATENAGEISAIEKSYLLNNSNSNITKWIEVLPDSIKINGRAELNPLGNISNYNDFISDKSMLRCDVDLRIPLKMSLTNLVLRDTTSISWPGDEHISLQHGTLYLLAKNSFPANVALEIRGLDGFNNVVLNLNQYLDDSHISSALGLISGSTDHTKVSSLLKFNLDLQATAKMNEVKKIAIKAKFETENYPQ